MYDKSRTTLELNKILSAAAQFAVLERSKKDILHYPYATEINEVRRRLDITEECDRLLFHHGVSRVGEFGEFVGEPIFRAQKGSALSCGELLDSLALLRAARCAYEEISAVEGCEGVKKLVANLYFNKNLEEDIAEKILSVDAVSDHASEKLYAIRSRIRSLNEKIRTTLSEYVSGKNAEYLQDAVVTMRNDRYVIPVKAEHKSRVRGFVHDRSKTGATFFIEPEYVLELNNELAALAVDEREEVEAILKALSARIGAMAQQLHLDINILCELDRDFAFAEYSYSIKATRPAVNDKGYIHIAKGRHPLIDKDKVVPVSVELGKQFNLLLLSGANTGGKTVTMKMIGLFCQMAGCGLFIPAAAGSEVSVFWGGYFCGIGDSQSIEASLSTFSSHILNVSIICENAKRDSLVLIDELGSGTNPDEGQAIAKAVVKRLLKIGCKGVITTHFTSLKEYAYTVQGIENASMEFDSETLEPLYHIKMGLPGASNALAIARKIGLDNEILSDALSFLSEGARNFENVVRRAEESRVEADRKLAEADAIRRELSEKLDSVNRRIEELNREKEKITRSARSESRRIVNEKTARAEELLEEIESIFRKEEMQESDLIRARTLKNKLKDYAYEQDENGKKQVEYAPASSQNIEEGTEVFIKPLESRGRVVSINKKGEAEVECGSIKMHLKYKDLQVIGKPQQSPKENIKVVKTLPKSQPILEINIIGLTVGEALYEVDNFIDKALLDNLEEFKVIHGVGTGKLRNAIHEHLKRHRRVESFRLGKYGEGETGVTFIKLK